MEQKTFQINIEDNDGIKSFVIYQIRYQNKGNDAWNPWLSYIDKESARHAVETLESLPNVNFACIDTVQVFI